MLKSHMNLHAESEVLEFKQTLAEMNEAGEVVSSFLNKRGGKLQFGVKNNGVVVGLKSIGERTITDISQKVFDNISPRCIFDIEIVELKGKVIIEISVQESPTPYHTYKNRPYIRIGNTTKIMPQSEYQRRLMSYQNIQSDYSASLVEGVKITDLSRDAILELKTRLKSSARYTVNIDSLSTKQLLKDLLLMRNDKLTIASLVLLAKEDSLYNFFPYAEIRYGYKANEQEIRNQDTAIFKGGYLTYYDEVWEKINNRNLSISIPLGMRIIERKAFDEVSIREAVNNAVAHRDYTIKETSFIFQLPSKISIKSPGGFPEGITVENIIDETKPRNKLLADILFKCDIVEQFGNGVNLMYQNQLSVGKSPPDYSKTTDHNVILRLDGTINDIEFAKYVIRVAESIDKELNDEELIILNKIKRGLKIDEEPVVLRLFNLGLIEKAGYGKYMLSKQYYVDTNQKATYTKIKGITKNTQKELILQHLRNFDDGARKVDFSELFKHELTSSQIDWLLKSLKKDQKVYFDGKQRSSKGVWRLVRNQ